MLNQKNLDEIKTKISGLEFILNEKKTQIDNLQRESVKRIEEEKNKLNNINDTQYKEFIEQQQNKNELYTKQIEELNKKGKEDIEKIEKELNNIREKQNEINKINMEKMQDLSQKLKENNDNLNKNGLNDNNIQFDKNLSEKLEKPDEYEPNDAMKEEKIPKFSREDSILCNLNPKNKKYSLFYLNYDELKDIPGNFEKKDLIELIYFLRKKGAKIFINFYKPVEEEKEEEVDEGNQNQDNEILGETYDSSGKINEKEMQRKKEVL